MRKTVSGVELMTLYQSLADRLQVLIRDQVYPVGSRLPGVRVLAEQQQVSVSTAVNACRELEQPPLAIAWTRRLFHRGTAASDGSGA